MGLSWLWGAFHCAPSRQNPGALLRGKPRKSFPVPMNLPLVIWVSYGHPVALLRCSVVTP